jgi:single-strand DNA-binding protein
MPATTPPPATAADPGTTARPGKVTKVGNLTRPPELGFGRDSGTAFARVGLAVETPVEAGNWAGERKTEFYEVTAFGSLAEHVAECLTKGTRVIVTGRPEVDHWTAEDGTARVTKRILADAVGPDLRWATAQITRAERARQTAPAAEFDDDEPF